ncbi:hypothetical protein T484DRAFT_1880778 [Baffinella frigidus]|nr:hypothetical protein T484DRAFT_1880778 [Cryptophyta sp. CCMP2293]
MSAEGQPLLEGTEGAPTPVEETAVEEEVTGAKRKVSKWEDGGEKKSKFSGGDAVVLDETMKNYLVHIQTELDKMRPVANALPICAKLLQLEMDTILKTGIPIGGPGQITASNTTPLPSASSARSSGGSVGGMPSSSTAKRPDRPASFQVAANSGTAAAIAARGTTAPEVDASMVSHEDLPGGMCKSSLRVVVPLERHPNYNFIGRLLGPRGNTLKQIQMDSGCKMAIRGRGTVKSKDGQNEQQMALNPNYAHLNEPMHVMVDYEGPRAGRDAALTASELMLRELMVPPVTDDTDPVKRQQLRDLAIMNGTYKETTKSFGGSPRPTAPWPLRPPSPSPGSSTARRRRRPTRSSRRPRRTLATRHSSRRLRGTRPSSSRRPRPSTPRTRTAASTGSSRVCV